ncbi:hypothetical protein NFI96_002604 [Prochilodus magdalenae]|nr:hypothetical protein NFI96_002604 [Prochilodus magdalenae]
MFPVGLKNVKRGKYV